jgi:probable rRNA maturation factor
VMKHTIHIRSTVLAAGRMVDIALLRRSIRMALEEEKVSCPCHVDVLLTDDEGIRAINRKFRRIDKATDVLSFPLQELVPGHFVPDKRGIDPAAGRFMLGDIVISLERVRAQARQFGHSVAREGSYLCVHAVLHLLGYDHVDEGPDKRLMRSREKAIMARIGEGK